MNKEPHYQIGEYITHQADGVHIEARCTCGAKFHAIGADEQEAREGLLVQFLEHMKNTT